MRTLKCIKIFIFVAAISLTGILTICLPKKEFSEFENRDLTTSIDVDVDSIADGTTTDEVTSFLNDQFPLRDLAVTLRSYVVYAFGAREINGVYLGKNDYLIEAYHDSDLNDDDVKLNVECLSNFLSNAADTVGYDHVKLGIIPGKEEVLDDYLPANVTPLRMTTKLNKWIKAAVDSDIETVDLGDVLSENKEDYVFYKTDHHWTSYGAGLAYTALTGNAVTGELEQVSDEFYGTTYSKTHMGSSADEMDKYVCDAAESATFVTDEEGSEEHSIYYDDYLSKRDKYSYFMGGNYGKATITTGTKNGKSLLVIKDSYTNSLLPYLCQDYETIVLLDPRYMNGTVYDNVNLSDFDDIYVIYNQEKFMEDTHQEVLYSDSYEAEDSEDADEEEDDGFVDPEADESEDDGFVDPEADSDEGDDDGFVDPEADSEDGDDDGFVDPEADSEDGDDDGFVDPEADSEDGDDGFVDPEADESDDDGFVDPEAGEDEEDEGDDSGFVDVEP